MRYYTLVPMVFPIAYIKYNYCVLLCFVIRTISDNTYRDLNCNKKQWSTSYCSDSSNNPSCYISRNCTGEVNPPPNSLYRSPRYCSGSSPKFDDSEKIFMRFYLHPLQQKQFAVPAVRIIKKRNTANKRNEEEHKV
ncbi:unnamed protein product [Ceratitis capitata]|uniref:(Mediterranean fruit fly) hypothetical protein n=1 Tax=Ceratitis capitata TaxID=7213 RepID=A0A811UEJ4_CERCA|nr:unnamed protein product [Ceratitis capitata]